MKQQLSQLLFLSLLAAQALSEHYELDIVTGSNKWDDTDGTFEATLICSKGNVEFGVLDNPGVNDFQVGKSDNFQADTDKNMGKVQCVKIEAKSDDAWMVESIAVKAGDDVTFVYNTEGRPLSSDTSEGKDVMQFCKQGDSTYVFEITTANERWADTDKINARIMISSTREKKGDTTTGVLDNVGINDFVLGATDTFTLPNLKNIGVPGCLFITAKHDDAWLFNEIKVTRDGNQKQARVFKNVDKVWLSSDKSEGKSELTICY